jgi:hypothetical protein
MAENYIVLRKSPDWLHFDLDESRAFCRNVGLPEDTIVRFAAHWRQNFALDYRQVRHEMKEIAVASISACRRSRFLRTIDHLEHFSPNDDDFIFFTDDDDWVAPNLFEIIRSYEPHDGMLWGSIFLGKMYADTPREKRGTPALQKRQLDDIVRTNNYCVTGRALRRLGLPAVFEHYHAEEALLKGNFLPQKISSYLSCANKHPCCTVSIQYNADTLEFRERLRETIISYARELEEIRLDADTLWISPYLHRLGGIMRRAWHYNP